jgi:hypothetical protein
MKHHKRVPEDPFGIGYAAKVWTYALYVAIAAAVLFALVTCNG